MTPASVYSVLQRAHKAIDERLPDLAGILFLAAPFMLSFDAGAAVAASLIVVPLLASRWATASG